MLSRSRAFWPAAYAFFAVMLGTTLPTPLYPIYQKQFGLSQLSITVIFAVYAVSVIATLILLGRLSDEAGRRPLLLAGVAFSALSAAAFLLAGAVPVLLVGRALSGISAGIFTGTATAALLDLARDDDRAKATAIAVAANLLGLGTGQLLSGLLAQYAAGPLRLPYAIDLALLVPAAAALLLAPETVPRPRLRWRPQRLNVPPDVRRAFIPAAAAGFCGFAVFAVYGSVVPEFVAKELRVPNHALIGALLFALLAASAAGQLLVRRLGEVRSMVAGLGGLVLGSACLGLALVLDSVWPLVPSVVVLGAGQGFVVGAGLGAINQLAPVERRAEIASTYFIVLYVGLTIPVVSLGWAADELGLRPAAIAFCALVAAVVVMVGAALRGRGEEDALQVSARAGRRRPT